MKKNVLALTFCFSLGCVTVAHADFWGRLAHAADVNWRPLQKDTTNFFERNLGKCRLEKDKDGSSHIRCYPN